MIMTLYVLGREERSFPHPHWGHHQQLTILSGCDVTTYRIPRKHFVSSYVIQTVDSSVTLYSTFKSQLHGCYMKQQLHLWLYAVPVAVEYR